MMKIFISWSGERSRDMALCLSNWLPRVIQNCRTWVSDRDIQKGQRWGEVLGRKLEELNFGIICTTPENYEAPWLLFEAGALSKSMDQGRVCPVLLGINPGELRGPLTQFQSTVLEKEDVFKLVKTLNSLLEKRCLSLDILSDSFDKFWPDLETQMIKIGNLPVSGNEIELNRVLEAFARYGLPSPVIGSEAHFTSGFESHGLYSTVMEIAKKRLYIFGRKNRKVFDKEHHDFLSSLKGKIKAGLDFRVLFLDPEASDHIIRAAHRDDDFKAQLTTCIDIAKRVCIRHGIASNKICRKYSIMRAAGVIVVDDAVLYSLVRVSADGRAEKLTKAPFTIVNSTVPLGKDLCYSFLKYWQKGALL